MDNDAARRWLEGVRVGELKQRFPNLPDCEVRNGGPGREKISRSVDQYLPYWRPDTKDKIVLGIRSDGRDMVPYVYVGTKAGARGSADVITRHKDGNKAIDEFAKLLGGSPEWRVSRNELEVASNERDNE